jgi:hypothetical protein
MFYDSSYNSADVAVADNSAETIPQQLLIS